MSRRDIPHRVGTVSERLGPGLGAVSRTAEDGRSGPQSREPRFDTASGHSTATRKPGATVVVRPPVRRPDLRFPSQVRPAPRP